MGLFGKKRKKSWSLFKKSKKRKGPNILGLATGIALSQATGAKFRKKIKVGLVNFNLSKSGVSTTIGSKGLSMNIGKKNAYLNMSIPGTGVYWRNKISSSTDNFTRDELVGKIINKQEIKIKDSNQAWFDFLPKGKCWIFDNGVVVSRFIDKKPNKYIYFCPYCENTNIPSRWKELAISIISLAFFLLVILELLLFGSFIFLLFALVVIAPLIVVLCVVLFVVYMVPEDFVCPQCGHRIKENEMMVIYQS